jgi:hypothetical protein
MHRCPAPLTPLVYEHLKVLIDRIPNLSARLESKPAPALTVLRKDSTIAVWSDDGDTLLGEFNCEAALIRADSAEEAFALTAGRATA